MGVKSNMESVHLANIIDGADPSRIASRIKHGSIAALLFCRADAANEGSMLKSIYLA
jgi:hypothetical protein